MKTKNKTILICAVSMIAVAIVCSIFLATNSYKNHASEENAVDYKADYQTTEFANTDAETVIFSDTSLNAITDISLNETTSVGTTSTAINNNAEKNLNTPATTKSVNQAKSEKPSVVESTTLQASEKHLPWGTAKDFDVQRVQEDANRYVSSFEGVELDRTLNVNNSCWTLYVSSYDGGSEEKLLARVKETARFQYERCVAGGNLEYDVSLRMNVLAVESYNEKLQATYYEYYILYFL